jgi:hypothetical protein
VNPRNLILLGYFSLLTSQLGAASIMVNEYYNGSAAVGVGTKMARDEYIEFVIVEKTSSASLAAMTFGDSNDATSLLQGVFKFDQATLDQALANAGIQQFLPGTILVVKGTDLGAQQLDYNPQGGGWSIQLTAGQGAVDHSERLINGNITLGNNGDVVWISSSNPPTRNTDTSGLIHAIGHDNAPGQIATTVSSVFGAENILNSTIATGRSVSNLGNTTESLQVVVGGTIGVANGGANSLWINGLRGASLNAVPEPGRAALMLVGLLGMICQRRRKGGCHV